MWRIAHSLAGGEGERTKVLLSEKVLTPAERSYDSPTPRNMQVQNLNTNSNSKRRFEYKFKFKKSLRRGLRAVLWIFVMKSEMLTFFNLCWSSSVAGSAKVEKNQGLLSSKHSLDEF
jgi:hypothetical protein